MADEEIWAITRKEVKTQYSKGEITTQATLSSTTKTVSVGKSGSSDKHEYLEDEVTDVNVDESVETSSRTTVEPTKTETRNLANTDNKNVVTEKGTVTETKIFNGVGKDVDSLKDTTNERNMVTLKFSIPIQQKNPIQRQP